MGGGVAHEQHGEQEGGDGDDGAEDDEHVAGRELGGEPAGESGREGDAAVAGCFVEAEGEAAPAGADEVDLHDDGHGPRKALVDAEQDVRGHDPAPAGRHGDQDRDREGERPAGDQESPSAGALGEGSGAEVGERLGETEGDDEREDGGIRREGEVLAADQRQGRALESDHGADEGVDGDQ